MPQPLHLKDAVAQWDRRHPQMSSSEVDELVDLHRAIWAGRADAADLVAARIIVDGELQRFAQLLDRIDERQGKKFRSNQKTVLQKVRAMLGYTYP